ncbi:MAG TPA: TetR/AcrR family transcriptional regulator C-terminal domain-containing protein [Acidimicrobiales bacterium]
MPPRTRAGLSRERVLRTALELVDREGVDALTMRRLGRELGVEAMSLYSYVENKQDLIEGVVEQVFKEMPLIVPGPGPWQERLRNHARAFRATLLRHPRALRLVAGRPIVTEGTTAFVESALVELRSIGLDLATADRVLEVIASFTLGHVAEWVEDDVRQGQRRLSGRHGIDRERFPNVATVQEELPSDPDAEFELGLDLLVAGLERLLESGPAAGGTAADGAAASGPAPEGPERDPADTTDATDAAGAAGEDELGEATG